VAPTRKKGPANKNAHFEKKSEWEEKREATSKRKMEMGRGVFEKPTSQRVNGPSLKGEGKRSLRGERTSKLKS